MSSLKSSLLVVLGLVALVAACVWANPMSHGKHKQQQELEVPNDPLPIGEDGSLFLSGGQECNEDEMLFAGALPICEPTCANPRPVCPKIFFSSIDFVPCFCKKPMVRNEKTKKCVRLDECPQGSPK